MASFNSRGITYAKVAHPTSRNFTGAPTKPGPNTLQREHSLLERVGVKPTMEPLRALTQLSVVEDTPPVASSSRKTLEDILPPPVAHIPNTGKGKGKKKKVAKTIIHTGLSRPPVVIEVVPEHEEIDWGTDVESPLRSVQEPTPMAQEEDFPPIVDERPINNYGYDLDGTHGVFNTQGK